MHKNIVLEIDASAIDEMAALVLELPGIAVASEMLALKEQHLADYQESKRFEAMASNAQSERSVYVTQNSQLKAEYDRTFDKVKSAEDQAYRLLMDHRRVSDYRAEFGGKLGTEARKAVRTVLMGSNARYQGWIQKLGELTDQMGEFDSNTEKVDGEIKQYGELAAKLMASSEDLFKQIQALRAKLNE